MIPSSLYIHDLLPFVIHLYAREDIFAVLPPDSEAAFSCRAVFFEAMGSLPRKISATFLIGLGTAFLQQVDDQVLFADDADRPASGTAWPGLR